MSPKRVKLIVSACCVLHNYLIQPDDLQSADDNSAEERVPLDGMNRNQPAVNAQDPRGIRGDLNSFLRVNRLEDGGE